MRPSYEIDKVILACSHQLGDIFLNHLSRRNEMSLLPSCQLTSVIVAVMLLTAVLTSNINDDFQEPCDIYCVLNRNPLRPISYIHVTGKIKKRRFNSLPACYV